MDNVALIKSNIANVYVDTDTNSELENQLIIGEAIKIISKKDKWVEINCIRDNSRGWIRSYHLIETNQINPDYKEKVIVSSLISDLYVEPSHCSEIITKITLSAVLQKIGESGDFAKVLMPCGRMGYVSKGNIVEGNNLPSDMSITSGLITLAKKFIGTPYLWGGRTPFGIDCSGFVQLIHLCYGIILPRNSYMQADIENAVEVKKEDIQAGDLVFFSTNGSRVSHVGMAINNEAFIHSCGAAGVIITEFAHHYYDEIFFTARRLTG